MIKDAFDSEKTPVKSFNLLDEPWRVREIIKFEDSAYYLECETRNAADENYGYTMHLNIKDNRLAPKIIMSDERYYDTLFEKHNII
jgi:hypothetical protein